MAAIVYYCAKMTVGFVGVKVCHAVIVSCISNYGFVSGVRVFHGLHIAKNWDFAKFA